MLTGSNFKKLLPQTSVNKDHVFFKKKKIISLCSITSKGQMFSEYPNVIRNTGQVDKCTDSISLYHVTSSGVHNTQRCKVKLHK